MFDRVYVRPCEYWAVIKGLLVSTTSFSQHYWIPDALIPVL